ncbi:MAG: hypothetical protein JNL42_14400 [Anaerolineae bacterium]|nr:hypothetical protein [Anaerolineae bacterium]
MVVTRPQTFMNPLGASVAAAQVDTFMRQFQIADDTDRVTAEWSRLLHSIPIGGRQVYDANITAAMLAYGVTHLMTNNGRDFARYSHLITVIPL